MSAIDSRALPILMLAALAAFGAAVAWAAAESGGTEAVRLRLDRSFSVVPKRMADGRGQDAMHGVSAIDLQVLRSRVDRLKEELRLRKQENEVLAAQISARETHIADLRRLLAVQEGLSAALAGAAPQAPPAAAAPRADLPRPMSRAVGAAADDPPLARTALQAGALFLVAVFLSLGLYLRSRLQARRLKAVDAEVRNIMRERDDSKTGHSVTRNMMESVRRKSSVVADTRAGGRRPDRSKSDRADPRRAAASTVDARLKEIDTLLAFEDFDGAAKQLNELIADYPSNPEIRLRLLHVQSAAGDEEAAAAEERVLAKMMEGPLSETLRRVRIMGQQLLPSHPLFSDDEETVDHRKTIRIDPSRR